jgi:CBS domain containing-hemolysin-like protein
VILLFNNTANGIIRSFGIEPKEELSGARSAEELSSLVRRSAMEGVLDADHAVLLHRTLRFSEHSAADVMTPRVRMTAVNAADTAEDIMAVAISTGYSRFPVIGEDRDDVQGVLHVKQAFAVALEDRADVTAGQLMIEPLRVPESMGVDTLLVLLRKQGLQVAIVSDEHGGTAGIVTQEDLVEEIVGEHEVPDGEEYDTLAGVVTDQLDRIPELGDEVRIEAGTLRVERVLGTHVERIRFTPDTTEEAPMSDHDRIVDGLTQELTHE